MIQIIKLLLGSPLPFYLFLLIFFVFFFEKNHLFLKKITEKNKDFIMIFCSSFLLISFFSIVFIYLFSNIFLDVISPSIISISWVFAQGSELYHQVSGPIIYSLLYGPTIFLINAFSLKIFGPNFFSAKIVSVSSLFFTFYFCYVSLKIFIKKEKILFFALFAGMCLLFWTFSFEARPDVFSLFFVSLGFFGATRKNEFLAILLTGFAFGANLDLKISGFFYFLPIFFILWKKFRTLTVFLSFLVGVLVSALPFFIFSNINLINYFAWLKNASMHPLDLGSFSNNITYTIFLLIPFVPMFFLLRNSHKIKSFENFYFFLLLASMLFVSIFAAKAGSGQNHLLPFLPLIFFGFSLFYQKFQDIPQNEKNLFLLNIFILPFFITIFCFSFLNMIRMGRLYYLYPTKAEQDIKKIIKKYPNFEIFMGYSDSGSDTNLNTNLPSFRPLLVFAGNSYILDKPALSDLKESGALLSEDFLDHFKNCKNTIWIFSRGTRPFEGVLGYGKPIFDQKFIDLFNQNYMQKESSEYYDLWMCKSN